MPGRIELDNQAAKSRFYISGDNSSFTGELVATGLNNNPGNTNDARDIQFATAASMGRGTITLNGRGFWLDSPNTGGYRRHGNDQCAGEGNLPERGKRQFLLFWRRVYRKWRGDNRHGRGQCVLLPLGGYDRLYGKL